MQRGWRSPRSRRRTSAATSTGAGVVERIGALVGFVSPWLYSAISGRTFDEGAWAVATMLVGYLLGALVAEIVVNRALESGPAAVMQPRRLTDYLPGHLLMWQRALGVLSLAMIVPYAMAQPAEGIDLPGVGSIASYALGGASIAVIVELIERAIVARRQSMADLADVKVDDALVNVDPCGRCSRLRLVDPVRRSIGGHHPGRGTPGATRRRGRWSDHRSGIPLLARVLDQHRAPERLDGSTWVRSAA